MLTKISDEWYLDFSKIIFIDTREDESIEIEFINRTGILIIKPESISAFFNALNKWLGIANTPRTVTVPCIIGDDLEGRN